MRKYDYSFLQNNISGDLFGLANVISDLNAREQMRKAGAPALFEELRRSAVIASVRGSNAIEGIGTAEDRLKIIAEGGIPLTHDEKEMSGYREALNLIHTSHGKLDFNEETILELHRLTESFTDAKDAGKYKERNNLIMEYHSDGTREIRFRPVSAEETPAAIEQLVLAYVDARQNHMIPDILLIPCVILDFLCIHPFNDGNGRVSRLLTVLLLYISGYDIAKYISYENQVDNYREAYYSALKKSSAGWNEEKNDYKPFIIFHMQILYRCFSELDSAFSDNMLKKSSKSERVRMLLLNSVVPVSKADILAKIPDAGVKTVEAVIGKLIQEEKIVKIGTYRNARYKIK